VWPEAEAEPVSSRLLVVMSARVMGFS